MRAQLVQGPELQCRRIVLQTRKQNFRKRAAESGNRDGTSVQHVSFREVGSESARDSVGDSRSIPKARCVARPCDLTTNPHLLTQFWLLLAAKRWHPDLNPRCDKATQKFQSITDAYQSAMHMSHSQDPSSRNFRSAGFGCHASGSGHASSWGNAGSRSSGHTRRPGWERAFNPQAQQCVYATMRTFDDAYFRFAQDCMRRAQQQDHREAQACGGCGCGSGQQSTASGAHETRKSDGAAWAWHMARQVFRS